MTVFAKLRAAYVARIQVMSSTSGARGVVHVSGMVDSAERGILAGQVRSRAVTHLVGQSRAYLQQLKGARDELAELQEPDLDPLLKAIEHAIVVVSTVNSVGSRSLRELEG